MKKLLSGIARALCVMAVCVLAGCSYAGSNGGSGTTPPATEFNWYETPVQLPAGTPGTYGTDGTYVYFGVWPQDVVPAADVAGLALDENATTTIERGYLKFVKGSDGNYYVKCAEYANGNDYKYKKDQTAVGQNGTSNRWFKVMPIKWRVVDTAYDVDGSNGSETAKLLVAENILTANVPYFESSSNRTISGSTVYPNNYMHSQIRAYLNGISYNAAVSTNNNKWYDSVNSKGKGFLQTAFGDTAITLIINTVVDNSEDSTTNYDTANGSLEKATTYACNPTTDKIFLLSEYEVTKYSKSTEKYKDNSRGNSRRHVTTDFSKANNAWNLENSGYGGLWLLRSPSSAGIGYSLYVSSSGAAGDSNDNIVDDKSGGVVPALCISF